MSIRIGIYGYGNLGRGVELAIKNNPDMTAVGVFTRRDPQTVKTLTGVPVYAANAVESMKNDIDVMILCGGSSTDLPKQTPALAQLFNVVDSIFKRWTRQRKQQTKPPSFRLVGIQECSHSRGCTRAQFCPTETIIRFGAKGLAKGIRTPFAVLTA